MTQDPAGPDDDEARARRHATKTLERMIREDMEATAFRIPRLSAGATAAGPDDFAWLFGERK